jgi:predicted nucleic acid-binding protein
VPWTENVRNAGLKKTVLDSFAVLAFLFKEAGHEKVLSLLDTALEEDDVVYVAAPNWAEVRYIIERKKGAREWENARTSLLALPIEIRPADQAMAELAGEIKSAKKMSLADCFAAALASELKAEIYTGDPEFHEVEKDVKVIWLK